MPLSVHAQTVLPALRVSAIRAVRHKGEVAYTSKNGPVPASVVAELLQQRLVTSVLDEDRRCVYYRLTERGRATVIELPQTGITNDELQA